MTKKIIEADVLYEDNHLIALNKKASDIVQGDKTGDEPLNEKLKQFLREKYSKPGNVFVGTIHRIDRPVSGVVLFAKTSKGLARMNELFREDKIEKTYWAVVKNRPELETDTITHYLIKNQQKNKSFATKDAAKKGLKSTLTYTLINSSDNYHLIEVKPITGRHHQIRVQLAAIGSPIKGDLKYGFDRTNKDASIHLHARKVSFEHPISKEKIEITAPVPDEALWKYFESLV